MDYQPVKGTHDIYLEECEAYASIENILKNVCLLFNFKEFRTPIIEHTELFERSTGESSDVVRKQMYTFLDKGDRSITLRPELTAGVIRSMVSNKLVSTQDLPIKAFYYGPVFRYERPKQGTYRQFNQFGIEAVGIDSYILDVEAIRCAYLGLEYLGLKNVTLKINTLGNASSRAKYAEALKEYFSKHIDDMCSDCKERLNINPLRILDCKVEDDFKYIKDAPKLKDYLSKEDLERYELTKNALSTLGIDFVEDDNLVRGLDYYSHIVFEFAYTSEQGKNYGAVGGGGHYDNLVNEIGGPQLSGVGYSIGLERLYSVLKDDNLLPERDTGLDFFIMAMPGVDVVNAQIISDLIRSNCYSADMMYESKSFKAMFKRALKKQAKFVIIIGPEEVEKQTCVLKHLKTGQQIELTLVDLDNNIESIYNDYEMNEEHNEDASLEGKN